MTFATTDLCDDYAAMLDEGTLAVLSPVYRSYGQKARFCGPAITLQVYEDNALVRSTLETPGQGRVLVVDGGASLRRALVGGQLAMLAQNNGWAGMVIHGCIRDSEEINVCQIGVRALATHPRKSGKTGAGKVDVPVHIADVTVLPGDWIYADADGVLVARQELD
ncbi:ribonuclease E activity regulator RraA [Janthinobacterium aquaticum]|uniref:ribonuclease E activity regulator RraA n=1 Tax=Janthinobacterium sp. FT58W TaxID=2654254 RepID=UPI001264E146|nr:ribonuclease E activity regulator RraA [Janthinobacterium sp. FT58W]KAB8045340.1 ribonuclease E activity regulator RraA [Janthinobacterium sp. FT58W]